MPLGLSWHDYNESLVERGRIIFDFEFASSWKKELKSMNKHKVGRPYESTDSYIEFLSFLKVGFDIPYKMVEEAVEALFRVHLVYTRHLLHADKEKNDPSLVGEKAL